ncbi:MAG: helix-turn-helix domain-containing protein [Nitrospinae bacterium]|nr:helix-turn-helix domain-containing protein [Nitrospinota bacterium]
MAKEKLFKVRDLRKKEQFIIDDVYLNGWAKRCGIYATGVYMSLCRHADKCQGCYPSQNKIAEELNISVSQVKRAIKILERHKIIKRVRVGKRLCNVYFLLNRSEWLKGDSSNRAQVIALLDTSNIKDAHKKDTHLSPLSPINKNLRENILKRIKKYFPDTNFPEDMPTEKLDYLLFKIEEGKINPERIKIPTAYCKAISITEEFPDFRERERQKAEIENAKREKEKIEKEERENIDWEENLRSCRKLQQELSN